LGLLVYIFSFSTPGFCHWCFLSCVVVWVGCYVYVGWLAGYNWLFLCFLVVYAGLNMGCGMCILRFVTCFVVDSGAWLLLEVLAVTVCLCFVLSVFFVVWGVVG